MILYPFALRYVKSRQFGSMIYWVNTREASSGGVIAIDYGSHFLHLNQRISHAVITSL